MKCKPLVAMFLLAGSLPAFAGQQIAPVQVTGSAATALEFSCDAPVAPSRAEVERVLQVNDNRQTHQLGNRLMVAVGEACNAGVARIEVQRAASGQSLTWTPLRDTSRNVAAN